MKVLVTGGTGVVGPPVIRALVSSGYEVRGLARSDMAAREIEKIGAEAFPGDIEDSASLGDAVDGAEIVFHIAGVNELCSRDPQRMYRVNVLGTRNVVDAAKQARVRRLVLTSSAATLGEPKGTVGHEGSPHRGRFLSKYERTKFEAERLAFSNSEGVEVISVNPSSVQGAGRSTGSAAVVIDVASGRRSMLPATRFGIVDIEDCAAGHLLAAQVGQPGQRYVLNGANLTSEDAISLLSAALGRELNVRTLGAGLVRGVGAVMTLVSRFGGQDPLVCGEMIRVMSHGHAYDGSRATRDLGLEYRAVAETIRRLVAWAKAEGILA